MKTWREDMMKKLIAWVLAVMMMCTALGALAEENGRTAPLYATVAEALAAAAEKGTSGGEEDYFAVVTEKDGTYWRSVAEMDDRAKELQQAIWNAEPDQIEAAFAASSEYLNSLPIAYSEAFTVVPMTQAEMDALVGKTLGELREMGYDDRQSGSDTDGTEYVMRNGLYDYACLVDADLDAYEKAQEDPSDCGKDFVVKSVKFQDITAEACLLRYHTDGTVEEAPDPFAEFAEVLTAIQEMIEAARNGEKVDVEAFGNMLKEKYPDQADSIDMYVQLFQMLGADALAAMLTPAE